MIVHTNISDDYGDSAPLSYILRSTWYGMAFFLRKVGQCVAPFVCMMYVMCLWPKVGQNMDANNE